jgi:hypothetical protein
MCLSSPNRFIIHVSVHWFEKFDEQMTQQPKMDFKMLVVPAMLILSRNIDMKDEKIIQMLQGALITVAVIIFSLHFYVYSIISRNKDTKKIWVPPKPKPQLPFGLGPPSEPVKVGYLINSTLDDGLIAVHHRHPILKKPLIQTMNLSY